MYRYVSLALTMLLLSACTRSPESRKKHALEQGRQHLEGKDYSRAIIDFRNASQADPRDPEPFFQLGLAYLAQNDIGSAIGAFRKATDLSPQHAGAQIKLAELLSAARDEGLLKDAADRMNTVLSSSPNNPEALSTLAYTELRLGQFQSAEQHLAQAVTNSPTNVKAALGLAQLKIKQKKLDEAEQALIRATDQKPLLATPFIILGEFYVGLNKFAGAKQQFLHALEVEPNNGPALLDLGGLQLQTGEIDAAGATYKRLAGTPDQQYRDVYAIYLYQMGKKDQAIRELERLMAADPGARSTRQRLMVAYTAAGKTAEADALLAAALKKNPKDTDALIERSRALLARGDYEQAATNLNHVVRFEPNSADAHHLLAYIHKSRGNTLYYRQELTEAVRLNPALLSARLELAQLLIDTNAAKSALEVMDQTPDLQKKHIAAVAQRNWVLLALGDKDGLRTSVDESLKAARTTDFLLQDAILKVERREFSPARAALTEVLDRNPEELRALELLTRTHMAEKQTALAVRKVRDHVAAHPASARLQHYLGTLLERTGEVEEARNAYRAAKAVDPSFWAADISLAQLSLAEKKYSEVRNALLPLTSKPSVKVQAHRLLAIAEEQSGNRDAAVGHYRKILESQPGNLFALNNLAASLAEEANGLDEALKIAQRAKELAPDNAGIDDTLGWVLYKKGMHSTAVEYLRSSVKREPNATRHAHLAILYADRGDKTHAIEELSAAIALNASHPEVKHAVQRLATMK